jgi:hypothetical protein
MAFIVFPYSLPASNLSSRLHPLRNFWVFVDYVFDDPHNHQTFEPMHKIIQAIVLADSVIHPRNQFRMARLVVLNLPEYQPYACG